MLTAAEKRVLRTFRDLEVASFRKVANKLGINNSAVQKTVDRLVKKGYAKRNPLHTPIQITPSGHAALSSDQ